MAETLVMLVGLVLLAAGAELLVRCSTSIASRLGISPLIIGLTIVSFGTSAPELVASVAAALRNSPGIAIGNIVGSNITNGLLVAGVTALVMPMAVASAALKRDGAVALGAAVVFGTICALQALTLAVGAAFLLGLATYIFLSYRSESSAAAATGGATEPAAHDEASDTPSTAILRSPVVSIIGCIVGIGLLASGGGLLVDAAVDLARGLGVSEAVVGLTIVAIGTSLPELATSVTAALRGKADLAIGNVIGSNIFNILGIGGVTAMLSQGAVPSRIISVDIPVMIAVTAVLLVFAATGRRIGRREGALLACGFGAYTAAAWLVVG